MKLKLGLTWSEKFSAQRQWHGWFAWRPVWVAHRDWRWLETVERVWEGDGWAYRAKTQ